MNQQGTALQPQKDEPGAPAEPGAKDQPGAKAEPGIQDPPAAGDDFNEVELLAMELGWNPDHEGQRDFVDAQTFIKRGGEIQKTMQRQILTLKTQGEDFKEAMVNLKSHYAKLNKVEAGKIDSQITELDQQLDAAIQDGDVPKTKSIQASIDNLKDQKRIAETAAEEPAQQPGAQPAQQLTPAAQTWLDENPWYTTDPEMKAYADTQSDRFRGLPEDKYFIELTKSVKAMYADRFQPPRRHTPVEPGSGRPQAGAGKGKKFGFNDLSDDQKRMAKIYDKQGVMKVQEYVDELARIGELT